MILATVVAALFVTHLNASPIRAKTSEGLNADTTASKGIKISARDSIFVDTATNRIRLYGHASLRIDSVELKADVIDYNWISKKAKTRGIVSEKIIKP